MEVKNAATFNTGFGSKNWLEVTKTVIQTYDPSIFLACCRCYTRNQYYSFAELNFAGYIAMITQDTGETNQVRFEPNFYELTKLGEQIWQVDHLLRKIDIPEHKSFPRFNDMALHLRGSRKILDQFESRNQQNVFVDLISTLLSGYDGTIGSAVPGKLMKGKVVFW